MRDELEGNQRRRDIAVLLARGLARVAKTHEWIVENDDEAKPSQRELAIAEGGE